MAEQGQEFGNFFARPPFERLHLEYDARFGIDSARSLHNVSARTIPPSYPEHLAQVSVDSSSLLNGLKTLQLPK